MNATITKIDINNVMGVYSGINGKCCCGCAGKHTYASKHRKLASKHRGYEVDDDEVNDRTLKLIVNKINKATEEERQDALPDYYAAVIGKRLYVAYLIQSQDTKDWPNTSN